MTETPQSPEPNDEFAGLNPATVRGEGAVLHSRVAAVIFVARYHGVEIYPESLKLSAAGQPPTPPELIEWLRESGLWARGGMMNFRQLTKIDDPAPIVLLLNDGNAALVVGRDTETNTVLLRDPRGQMSDLPMPIDELRLKQVWSGAVLLIRASRAAAEEDQPFNLAMLGRLVWIEKKTLGDIAISSVTLTILGIVPILMIMGSLNAALQYHSLNTLELVIFVVIIALIFEMILTWSRKMMEISVGSRLDAKLNLLIFDRLMALPIEFFEKNQAGDIAYKVQQIYMVRQFLTGSMMNTFIDVIMVLLILPILFYLNATLAWTIVIAAGFIALIIGIYIRPMALMLGRVIQAESAKSSVIIESIYGIRTVKALALEPMRAAEWDRRVADTTLLATEAAELANWPATLTMPFQRYCQFGVLALGAYLAVKSNSPLEITSLFGFMMLGGRVAGPLVSIAGFMQEVQRAQASIGQVGGILNRPTEKWALTHGLRPKFEGEIEFDDVTFRYEGTKTPALDKMTFKVPAGTMLGLVGRSGSGKSTVTRLLQGINRDYSGTIKIDGTDMREINLRHLRKNFGMVLQDNFLFRGSVRDNIIAGRPGISFEDAVQAARLAGAEEFIERLPNGYNTFIQEGSPNLSGGQKQRLAIARAVVSNPRVLILDEATSALDPESEALVNANLLRIAAGRTMVIVSHRLSSLIDCDMIMVLERGRTVDIGPHEELLERCAIYRHLWLQQNRHLDPQNRKQPPVAMSPAEGD